MKYVVFLLILTLFSCNRSDGDAPSSQQSDIGRYEGVNGYTWSCPDNNTSIEQCSQLGLQCGQVCDALEGFTVTDIDTSGTCVEGGVNALKEVGSCVFANINFSCNSAGKIIGSGGGISVQTNVYNWEGTKFYCQNNPDDLSGSFPVEVNLIFD